MLNQANVNNSHPCQTDDFLMTKIFSVKKKRPENRLKHSLVAGLKNLQNVVVLLSPTLIFAVDQRHLSTFLDLMRL
ncbi:hypothetical protein SAMN04487894_11616 [Niabella drilacis]|uniref:Uncharacterized protein n=1 Tax=Niabella drilacis (strain DSM 25811 / CCM 8410 / CCUG 62505 / LMG 26954 / E90) TaxID=1285928 RepID=A0A1G6YL33_NIADE|nr:hypothetical protein SAMN04487894_11616 [Niabella drilacis]